jgi:hypothetical protein
MTTATTPASAALSRETEFVTRAAWRAGVLGAVNALFVILAVRAILLVAVVGALVLAWTVAKSADPIPYPSLIMLVVYGLLVVIPVVWLSSRR